MPRNIPDSQSVSPICPINSVQILNNNNSFEIKKSSTPELIDSGKLPLRKNNQ